MSNMLKKFSSLFILFFALIIIKPTNVSAYDYVRDYTIDDYYVDIVVNENNTLNITEKIKANFNVPKHGIIRKIPIVNNVKRLDGTSYKNHVKIKDLHVNEQFKASTTNNYKSIQIGSASRTITGEKEYEIRYVYDLGKDKTKNYDELYFNIIGDQWDTTINNISFKITMPKDFDESKLGFSSGKYSSTDTSNIYCQVNDNVITGRLYKMLSPGEAFTVRLELPDGYFTNVRSTINFFTILLFLFPITFLIISLRLWHKYGRDDEVIETVEFYPPEGLNSLDVGFCYKGQVDSQDVTSLLIYLANKGYLKITEVEKKGLLSKSKDFCITKLKDYDGTDENERRFFNGLFGKKDSVTSDDLYNSFYKTMNRIMLNVLTKENKQKIFDKKASSKSKYIIMCIMATFCIITIPPLAEWGGSEMILFALIFPGFGFTILFSMVFGSNDLIYINGESKNSALFVKLFGLVFGLFFGGIPWLLFVYPYIILDEVYVISYIVGIICILGMTVSLTYLPKRTPFGNQMLGKLRGFRNFLITAEKDKLEAMVMENPTYFYDILPYTYVLGVSNKWIKQFESISMKAPDWYDSTTPFDTRTFGSFMNSTMKSAKNSMTSSPSSSSSSGGFSSGGGFSGGGSGGGGGSSW